LIVAAPTLWVGLEFVRAYVLTGFPWYYLAHSQHGVLPVIQIADFAGALGLSFVIAAVNATWVDLLALGRAWARRRQPPQVLLVSMTVPAILVAFTIGYGTYRLASAQFRPGPRLALIQSNMVQGYKMKAEHAEILAVYQQLIARAAAAAPRPELIVWPETAY